MPSSLNNIVPGPQVKAYFPAAAIGGRFVVHVAGGWRQANATGEQVDGILLADVGAGKYGTVCRDGVYDIESGAAVADGALLMTDNVGRAVTWVTGAHCIAGKSLTAVAALGLNMQSLLDPCPIPA